MRIIIIGGGISGARCAFNLARHGYEVLVFEKETVQGGLARSFELHGAKIERYYHFICGEDTELVDTVKQLGLESQLQWKYTRMGSWREGRLFSFTSILDLLKFPPLRRLERIKYLWATFRATRRKEWSRLENVSAVDWLKEEFGQAAYDVIWNPLLKHKFGHYSDRLSAAWIWSRIKRIAASRTPVRKRERLGYLMGGTETLFDRLNEQAVKMGARIHTGANVERILVKDGHVRGIYVDGTEVLADTVISTVPLPRLVRMLPEGAEAYGEQLGQTKFLNVACLFFRLTRSLSPYFWINVSGDDALFPGIIEYTNLNPRPDINGSIVYIPHYLPRDHPFFTMGSESIIKIHVDKLIEMFPHFERSIVKDAFVFRDSYAQPVCETGFTRMAVSQKSPLQGLFVIDASQLHPHDRSISPSIGLADSVTQLIKTPAGTSNERTGTL